MTVLDIKDISTEDAYIYYRKSYTGTAILELQQKPVEVPIKFLIETEPTGKKNIEVNLKKEILYPILPVVKELKKTILHKSDSGILPC